MRKLHPMNARRVRQAAIVVKAYKAIPGTDPDCWLRDLLADLMLYCKVKGLDFTDELRIASGHFRHESAPDYCGD